MNGRTFSQYPRKRWKSHHHLRPRGLTFTWWGCYGLCLWHKPTELAHSFLFYSCVCFCLYGPFNFISFHKFSRHNSLFFFPVLILPYWSFKLYISLWKSPSALIYPLWLTGLKTPTNSYVKHTYKETHLQYTNKSCALIKNKPLQCG